MSPLYRQILTAAAHLDGVPLQELEGRYPEGEFFAIRCHGEGLICAPPPEDTDANAGHITMTPVVTVPERYLGRTWSEVQVLRERVTLEGKIDDLRRTIAGKREFRIPLQEAVVADRRKKLEASEATLLELQTATYEQEQELFALKMTLEKLIR